MPEVISDTIKRVAAGARAAGRDPSEVEVWLTTRSSLDADRDKAIERIHASVSSILNHSMRFGLEGKNVPSQFRAKIAEYVEGYELYDHVFQARRNPKRMAELGLTQYGLERFALAGNVNAGALPVPVSLNFREGARAMPTVTGRYVLSLKKSRAEGLQGSCSVFG